MTFGETVVEIGPNTAGGTVPMVVVVVAMSVQFSEPPASSVYCVSTHAGDQTDLTSIDTGGSGGTSIMDVTIEPRTVTSAVPVCCP